MMKNMKIVDDSIAYLLSEEQDTGIVIHEDKGEILRLGSTEKDITFDQLDLFYFIDRNEPVSKDQIRDEYDADEEKIEEVLDTLNHRGQIYQPQKGKYRVVPEQPDKSRR